LDKLRGLSLFSGIGGIDLAIEPWVDTVAYCEADRYAQAVLLSRMAEGQLPNAPIWNDVTTLTAKHFGEQRIDIIFGGSPCQDISLAGLQRGLEGSRSRLFYEIIRLAKEIQPTFIFLENVPSMRTKGLDSVGWELANAGYDCRWTSITASETGAPHKRDRWFLLGYSEHFGQLASQKSGSLDEGEDSNETREKETCQFERSSIESETMGLTTNTLCEGLEGSNKYNPSLKVSAGFGQWIGQTDWWETESGICRVADGVPSRVDRIKCLGNGVVPRQVRQAFKELMGL
jgi:DNA (cytosine-5)-methyltransferase 1